MLRPRQRDIARPFLSYDGELPAADDATTVRDERG